ncbi:MAG: UxaA family hydrolase [Deltaproteobacteria bacterium]|nr:UxaA family hydrolase [Deltaproteobacteria bacterium]
MRFLGYLRPDGSVGIRNYVLVLPATRLCYLMAHRIGQAVTNTKTFITTGEYGRHKRDRQSLMRMLVGLARNPNVAATVLLGVREGYGYPEFQFSSLIPRIASTGKPLVAISADEEGGLHRAVEKGIIEARRLVHEASALRREPFPLEKLTVGVKCGSSDPTSGISGNPSFGNLVDRLVGMGGTAIFSETVEIIGAEDVLAQRAVNQRVADDLYRVVRRAEERAAGIGEDIRTINPIPENIAAGITTLEEKSLGAIAKSGTSPLQGVLEYCRQPSGKGLYFMDGWMSSLSLPVSLAAAGCQMVFYQLGGQDLSNVDPPLYAYNSGLVAPLVLITGNPLTYQKAGKDIDMCTAGVLSGKQSIEEAGEDLLKLAADIASGTMAKGETVNFADPLEVFFEGPVL